MKKSEGEMRGMKAWSNDREKLVKKEKEQSRDEKKKGEKKRMTVKEVEILMWKRRTGNQVWREVKRGGKRRGERGAKRREAERGYDYEETEPWGEGSVKGKKFFREMWWFVVGDDIIQF